MDLTNVYHTIWKNPLPCQASFFVGPGAALLRSKYAERKRLFEKIVKNIGLEKPPLCLSPKGGQIRPAPSGRSMSLSVRGCCPGGKRLHIAPSPCPKFARWMRYFFPPSPGSPCGVVIVSTVEICAPAKPLSSFLSNRSLFGLKSPFLVPALQFNTAPGRRSGPIWPWAGRVADDAGHSSCPALRRGPAAPVG